MFPGWVAGIDSLSSAQNSISFRFLGCQNEIAKEGTYIVESVLILEVSYICRRKDHGK